MPSEKKQISEGFLSPNSPKPPKPLPKIFPEFLIKISPKTQTPLDFPISRKLK
jgi:hypothetical protein